MACFCKSHGVAHPALGVSSPVTTLSQKTSWTGTRLAGGFLAFGVRRTAGVVAVATESNVVASSPTPEASEFVLDDDSKAKVAQRQELFNKIAPMYDMLNDWLTLGQHRVWKRMTVAWSGAKAGDQVLDICCGSGDIALLLAQKVGPGGGKVVGLDFAKDQLQIAAERQQKSRTASATCMQWVQGDALQLPFEEETFDAVTVGYGLRNVTDIRRGLGEIRRVLKTGAKAAVLDFHRRPTKDAGDYQDWVLDNFVVPLATQFGMTEEYAYLKGSLASFPPGREQERLALEQGFSEAFHYELADGHMGVLVLKK